MSFRSNGAWSRTCRLGIDRDRQEVGQGRLDQLLRAEARPAQDHQPATQIADELLDQLAEAVAEGRGAASSNLTGLGRRPDGMSPRKIRSFLKNSSRGGVMVGRNSSFFCRTWGSDEYRNVRKPFMPTKGSRWKTSLMNRHSQVGSYSTNISLK